jgi:rubrerythrin
MKIDHPALINSLRLAYSAEKAAAYAYVGHARSLKNPGEKSAVQQIEKDEWEHRENVLGIMKEYVIPVSKYYEFKYGVIGRLISFSCYFIGRFMPYFFAGKLESGNVCEYFRMMKYFHSIGITQHDEILHEMGIKEKEHEVFFLEMIKDESWMPIFEEVFKWGERNSLNDVDLKNKKNPSESQSYCNKINLKVHNGTICVRLLTQSIEKL